MTTFTKVHRGPTHPDLFLDKGRIPDAPTIRLSHDPAFRTEYEGVVEFDLERVDEVIMALIRIKTELQET